MSQRKEDVHQLLEEIVDAGITPQQQVRLSRLIDLLIDETKSIKQSYLIEKAQTEMSQESTLIH